MPLRFEDDPELADNPLTPPGQFDPYLWDTLRNRLLFRLLARHGTIVASTLEFTARDAVTLTVEGAPPQKVQVHGGFRLKVNAPTKREFFEAPYLRNPYQRVQDDVHFSGLGWNSAQPLLMVGSAEQARAMLRLDRERMSRGPFVQDSFEKDYEPLNSPAFRYFIKNPLVLAEMLTKVPPSEASAGVLSTATEALLADTYVDEMAIQDLSAVDFTFNLVKRTQLGHLVDFNNAPDAYPAWRDYGTSEARRNHHLHKSHVHLDNHYASLDTRVGESTKHNTRPLTEARGEYLAAKVMAMVFAGERFELKMGFGDKKKAQGIDQIWARRHPTTQEVDAYFIVEAKGSKSAKHGQNKEETQMSPGWVFKKLVEQASSPNEDERLLLLAQKVLRAMFDEGSTVPVFGMTFKAIFDKHHSGETASLFNLQISKPLCFPAELKVANVRSLEVDSEGELFGTDAFTSVPAKSVGLLSSVPDSSVDLSKVSPDLRFGNVNTETLHKPKNSFAIVNGYHPEHPRNTQLISLLAAHSASILSVQDYFGVDPQKVKVGTDGKLRFFSGFATTGYGKGGHEHLKIDTLVDPSDQNPLYPGPLLIESDDPEDAQQILDWKRKNLKAPHSIPEPDWVDKLRKVSPSSSVAAVLIFFGMRPLAREELKRIMTTLPQPGQRAHALKLAFASLGSGVSLIEKSTNVGGKSSPLWKFILRLTAEGGQFLHHEAKSLGRLDKHYQSLEKLIDTSNASTALTEASGEFLGARAMSVIFGQDKLQLKMGHGEKKGTHGLDQIWAKRDESSGVVEAYFLVECKGSKHAELGQNVRETQMSPAWVFKKLLELAQDDSTRLKSLARKVLNAMFDAQSTVKVHGVIIQSLFDPGHFDEKKPRGRFNIRITSQLYFPDLLEFANGARKAKQGGQTWKQHSTILHDRMPLALYLPEFGGVQAIQKGTSPMQGTRPKSQQTNGVYHETVEGYLLSREHQGRLKQLNLKLKRVTADGECAYNTARVWLQAHSALWKRLGLTGVPSVAELKDEVVKEITQSPVFATQFLEPGQSLDDLKKKVAARHLFFGSHGDIVLPALAKRLRLRIRIIYPNGAVEDLNQSFHLGLSEDAQNGDPIVYAVLTSYMGIPENVAHYYGAIRLAPPQQQPVGTTAPQLKRKANSVDPTATGKGDPKKSRKGPVQMDEEEEEASPPPSSSSGTHKKPPPKGGSGGGFSKKTGF
ncbi:hypothetical protein HUW62_21375 [Myxococcus sp. AM011]|uniref:hypothetical protein n=1 Tax=Myxococcus sp. AM011 TaxID=2745200 RepID=UPI001595F9F4|nr:hypothetical protein [Myxococcus sp. AM011]NVJ23781.1 hypothetical protein [Myxococcus sp. AM011]